MIIFPFTGIVIAHSSVAPSAKTKSKKNGGYRRTENRLVFFRLEIVRSFPGGDIAIR